jgi:uncharacterized protein (DUF1786 family)
VTDDTRGAQTGSDGAPRERRPGAGAAAGFGSGAGAAILLADIGAGTADILMTLPGEPLENAVRLVVPSRTQVVAREIGAATAAGRTVVFTGPVMGGGASGGAMKRHVGAGLRFVAGASAASTFADDLDGVRARGVEVVSDNDAETMAAAAPGSGAVVVRSGDLDVDGLSDVLRRLGVSPVFDAVCVAAQDHGFCPRGSNRAFRFGFWKRAVAERRRLGDLFWPAASVPAEFTRLRAAAALGAELAAGAPVLVSDTGPAALYGALAGTSGDDEDVAPVRAILVNAGNAHTVCAVARQGRLTGVFEHHTLALDGARLGRLLRRFLTGGLTSAEVREDGGHGAVLAPDDCVDLAALAAPLLVTGPRRDLLRDSGLPLEFAAPHGDMMLTGCYGLLRAAREKGLVSAGA